jgi:hypothetical protein
MSFTLPLKTNSRWRRCENASAIGIEVDGKRSIGGIDVREISVRGIDGAGDCCLFFSDLHWLGNDIETYGCLAQGINACNPDWILFGGDSCGYMDTLDGALEWLGTLKARRAKLAVLGNREAHVEWHSRKFWKDVYAEAGFELLINESRDAGVFAFYGVDDYRYGKPDWNGVPNGKFCISMSHNPDAVADWDGNVGNLALCGHTHGGQIVLPALGPVYTSSRYGRQFLHGMSVRDDGAVEYTSSGIGESGFGFLHRRVRCPREMLLIRFIGGV